MVTIHHILKTFVSLLALFIFVGFYACKNNSSYEKYSKELDSLKIVLHQSVSNLRSVDSVKCEEAILKFKIYSDFLNKNLKDTVSIEQAKQLKIFYSAGEGIIKFQGLRVNYLTNSELRKIQLQNLSTDLKNGSVEAAEAVEYINAEKLASQNLIEEMATNNVRENMELFTTSLPVIEEVIKLRNAGSLPLVPKTM